MAVALKRKINREINLNENKFKIYKLKIYDDIQENKNKLKNEKINHEKTQKLLKQTIDAVKINLNEINLKNKEKEQKINSLQQQIKQYKDQYPSLSQDCIH